MGVVSCVAVIIFFLFGLVVNAVSPVARQTERLSLDRNTSPSDWLLFKYGQG